MSNIIDNNKNDEDFFNDDITDDDYGIILGPDGRLKSVFLPENVNEIPETFLDILDLLGVSLDDIDPIVTLH